METIIKFQDKKRKCKKQTECTVYVKNDTTIYL